MREFKRPSYRSLLVCLAALPILGQAQQVPRKSPEFVIQIPKGPQLLLSQFRGKVVALEFLFTTCPHCQHASQLMSKLYSELGPKGLQPVGIAFNDQANLLVPDFVREFGVNYPMGAASQSAVYSYLDLSLLTRIVVPQIVLIDRSGMIRLQTTPAKGQDDLAGEPALRARLEELLKEPPPHKSAVTHRKKKS
jgi:peroxiredoxin